MKLDEYQKFCLDTAFFIGSEDIREEAYLTIALSGEVGELSNWVKKWFRDEPRSPEENAELFKRMKGELGDILWYVAVLSHQLGYSLDEIVEYNKEKIKRRIENGTQRGSGDNR